MGPKKWNGNPALMVTVEGGLNRVVVGCDGSWVGRVTVDVWRWSGMLMRCLVG